MHDQDDSQRGGKKENRKKRDLTKNQVEIHHKKQVSIYMWVKKQQEDIK